MLPARLKVTDKTYAGQTSGPALAAGDCRRIFTGAPVPAGADAVIMQEDCTALPVADGGLGQVQVNSLPKAGQNIRRAGEDVARSDVVLSRGQRLGPAELGLAASIGMAALQVARRPRVALFSTGNELVMPGAVAPQDMPPGAIYNSNRYFLIALLRRLGCVVTDLGIVPDHRDATIQALRQAAKGHDLILTSGGVSVGEEDHRVAMKAIAAQANFTWARPDRRREFLRVRRNADGGLELFSNQSSGVLTSAVWGDGLIDNPPGCAIAPGDTVRFVPFSELLA